MTNPSENSLIDPAQAARKRADGALFVDVRRPEARVENGVPPQSLSHDDLGKGSSGWGTWRDPFPASDSFRHTGPHDNRPPSTSGEASRRQASSICRLVH
ncbi:hypothetical protein Aple_032550 [Acrocarpospora pleiomorpha]|uniref:Rhodanese domain-containing protein n=1 Tax=Acrocarpospora pleiomorpha TaxID=90975 RepID=A0A5M3XJM3_9ACTN|nr:hypothetical protein Aple_032550 [Acrocarpospora pleiomorpha]